MPLNNTKIFLCFWTLGLIAAFIFSLTPVKHSSDIGFLVYDKFLHLSCYFVMSTVACLSGKTWTMRYFLCFVTLLVSISIEFLQPLTGRSFEVFDMVANLLGIIIGILVMRLFMWRFPAFISR
ncbi:VanZ family protein [Sneathiella sp.]|uniref:VanZ family protein n=1 Tax=Sneathiella sp. TaxID=1964365 RepID=UPI003FA79389